MRTTVPIRAMNVISADSHVAEPPDRLLTTKIANGATGLRTLRMTDSTAVRTQCTVCRTR